MLHSMELNCTRAHAFQHVTIGLILGGAVLQVATLWSTYAGDPIR